MYEDKLTKEFLTEELVNNKKTLAELSSQTGIAKITLIRHSKKHGIYDLIKDSRKTRYLKSEDLTNQKIGKLTVIKQNGLDKHKKLRWLCRCDCGKEKTINASSLRKGLSKSCGSCDIKSFTGYKNVSGSWIRRTEQTAKKRNLEFNITAKDIQELYDKQDGKCALSGINLTLCRCNDKINDLQNASIDRIDNQKGYTLDNIQLIHKRLNRIKSVLNNDEFIYWCKLVSSKNTNNIEIDVENIKWSHNQRL